MYGPSMWIPASAACSARRSVRAHAAKLSSGDVMSVGRKRVTPVFSIAATARRTSSGVAVGSPKSTPAKPLT